MIARAARFIAALVLALLLPAAVLTAPEPLSKMDQLSATPVLQQVSPLPLQLACPGALVLAGGRDGTEVNSIERVGSAALAVQSGDSGAVILPEPAEALVEAAAFVLQTSSAEQSTELFSANQFQQISTSRLRGAAASNCGQPQTLHWLVGGSSSLGSETLLILFNPSAVETVATATVYGQDGEASATLSLRPGQELLVPIATISASEISYAVKVSAGTRILAALQHRTGRGLSATGVATVSSGALPASTQVIGGLAIRGSETAALAEQTTAVLRVFNPGNQSITVLAELVSDNSQVFGSVERLSVASGRVAEIALSGLADGNYAALLSAESEFLAAIYNPTLQEVSTPDFEWLSGGTKFERPLVMPVPGNAAELHITNSSANQTSLLIEQISVGSAGSVTSLTVAPRSTITVPVSGAQRVRISATSEGVFVAMSLTSTLGRAVVEPRENQNLGQQLLVLVR